ncbi:hypothetical protein [Coleofasciculus sp. F4-SAH-05]|uniref:hypothetical protein n=1 Tax=Coleofasciculus sp. F4-SAH-05 TaxID=3069525 RepID=UPI0032F95E1D
MNAKERFPFTVHRNTEFDRLIDNLINTGVIDLVKIDSAYKIEINKIDVFYEIFTIIFLQYSTPDISNILLSKETQQIILNGNNIGYILEDISSEALEILTILITKEDDADYENAFNALICVCLGSIKPCKLIFPNTYTAFSMLVRYIENKTFALTEANLVLLLYLTRLRNAV